MRSDRILICRIILFIKICRCKIFSNTHVMRVWLFNVVERSEGIGDTPQQAKRHDVYTSNSACRVANVLLATL